MAAAALRRWAARVIHSRQRPKPLTPTIYPTLLDKVETMKKAGVPTDQETSKILRGVENRLKTFRMFSEANARQVQGLLRNGLDRRVQTIFITVGAAAFVIEATKFADDYIDHYGSGSGK